MEPAFQRGDILFLTNFDNAVNVGDIVVFKIKGREIPIVHRVLRIHESDYLIEPIHADNTNNNVLDNRTEEQIYVTDLISFFQIPKTSWLAEIFFTPKEGSLKNLERDDNKAHYLTKGDNNLSDDRSLYAPGQLWVHRSEILGRAVGALPYVGMVTILLNDYPMIKYILVGLMALFVVTEKQSS